ncbi:MAG: tryptophan--tRNA ligase [Verrucomicrobia bacterium CG1_02_43_26]|nr:MAG: tryptophan--tRNA ligase [Verrucomicrobia bacterium CG1_02_43_26]
MADGKQDKKIILTCAQPTGKLHLGNYLGAIRRWTEYLDDNECLFGIVDLHAITVPQEAAELRKNTLDCVAQYIACGLDPAKCAIFVQSHVSGHTELAWVLGCMTPLGQLERMTQFKDKSQRQGGGAFINAGLLFYPVLMAADILLYHTDIVPVGDDQKQHLELARDLAQRFNNHYSDTFKVPEPAISEDGARIMSLQDPTSKMSKSDKNQHGVIYLWDEPDVLRKKILGAVTDSGSEVVKSADKPGVSNLLTIMSLATGRSIADIEQEFVGKGYGDFKAAVAEAVIELLAPIQKQYETLKQDKAHLESIIKDGAEVAQKKAYKMLAKVYRKTGFLERAR